MDTRPVDSVFGIPNHANDGHRGEPNGVYPAADVSDPAKQRVDGPGEATAAPGSEIEWSNAELHSIASTIEDLQRRLEQANAQVITAAVAEATEVDIGRLFVEAQRFSEDSLARLEHQI